MFIFSTFKRPFITMLGVALVASFTVDMTAWAGKKLVSRSLLKAIQSLKESPAGFQIEVLRKELNGTPKKLILAAIPESLPDNKDLEALSDLFDKFPQIVQVHDGCHPLNENIATEACKKDRRFETFNELSNSQYLNLLSSVRSINKVGGWLFAGASIRAAFLSVCTMIKNPDCVSCLAYDCAETATYMATALISYHFIKCIDREKEKEYQTFLQNVAIQVQRRQATGELIVLLNEYWLAPLKRVLELNGYSAITLNYLEPQKNVANEQDAGSKDFQTLTPEVQRELISESSDNAGTSSPKPAAARSELDPEEEARKKLEKEWEKRREALLKGKI